MPFLGSFFLRVAAQPYGYAPLAKSDDYREPPMKLARNKSEESRYHRSSRPDNLGTRNDAPDDQDDVLSLLSDSSDGPGDLPNASGKDVCHEESDSSHIDIRGLAMLRHLRFYQLWGFLGLMAGIGIMTIK